MAALHADLSADLGCRRNVSKHAHPPISVRIGEIKDIRPLYWCPGVIISHLYFYLPIAYEQPQRIRTISNTLQCDLCVMAKMSSVGVN